MMAFFTMAKRGEAQEQRYIETIHLVAGRQSNAAKEMFHPNVAKSRSLASLVMTTWDITYAISNKAPDNQYRVDAALKRRTT